MTVIAPLRLLAVIALLLAALADPGAAQPTAADPMAPRDPLPAPAALKFITPPEITDQELGIEQAVAIALANQPTIQNRASAYVAAQQRVAQALSPLLPQLSGQWNGFQQQELRADHRAGGTDGDRQRVDVRPPRPSPAPCFSSTSGRTGRPPTRPRPIASSRARAWSFKRTSSRWP